MVVAKNPFGESIISGGLFGAVGNLGGDSKNSKYERIPVSSSQKRDVLFKQKGKCAWPGCKIRFDVDGIPPHFDHIKRVDAGGKSITNNLQALCPNHHNRKTHNEDVKRVEKTRNRTKKKNENSPILGGNLFEPPKRGRRSNPFEF